jgi:hypothetical protein
MKRSGVWFVLLVAAKMYGFQTSWLSPSLIPLANSVFMHDALRTQAQSERHF